MCVTVTHTRNQSVVSCRSFLSSNVSFSTCSRLFPDASYRVSVTTIHFLSESKVPSSSSFPWKVSLHLRHWKQDLQIIAPFLTCLLFSSVNYHRTSDGNHQHQQTTQTFSTESRRRARLQSGAVTASQPNSAGKGTVR